MRAYIINLDSAEERWKHMQAAFSLTDVETVRIPAIDGATVRFPTPEFDEARYRRLHGREANRFEVGCYLSHLKALRAFLESSDEHALICEDDVVVQSNLPAVLASALRYACHWNVLRLAGLSNGGGMKVAELGSGFRLCVNAGRMKGAGAYVVDRAAAREFTQHLLPMWLPYDHAFDREWCYGLRCVSVLPFPISQTERLFRSTIQKESGAKLSRFARWLTTYPYQVTNEFSRWVHRFSFFALLSNRSPMLQATPMAPSA